MSVPAIQWTPGEKRFRVWMWLSFWMYLLGLPLFLFLGRQIAAFLNGFPARLGDAPPWPPAGSGMEVVFWQVLGVSLMAILAVLCLYIARNVRRYGPLIVALLAAKLVSTVCYTAFFIIDGNGGFLAGALTDGLIFLITIILWYLAAPADRYLDRYETRVLVAVGETILPPGGPFPEGYNDARDRCVEEARRMLSAQGESDVLFTRLMLRTVDLLPFPLGFFGRFHRLDISRRTAFFEKLEVCRLALLRMMATGLKLYVVAPFFNVPEQEGKASEGEA